MENYLVPVFGIAVQPQARLLGSATPRRLIAMGGDHTWGGKGNLLKLDRFSTFIFRSHLHLCVALVHTDILHYMDGMWTQGYLSIACGVTIHIPVSPAECGKIHAGFGKTHAEAMHYHGD